MIISDGRNAELGLRLSVLLKGLLVLLMLISQILASDTSVLLFKLSTTFTLFSLNSLALSKRKHLLVLNAKLAATDLPTVKVVDNSASLLRGSEVGKSQTPKNAIVKMVVKRIRNREVQTSKNIQKLLFFYSKGNVFDNNRGGNKIFLNRAGGRTGGRTSRVVQRGRNRLVTRRQIQLRLVRTKLGAKRL